MTRPLTAIETLRRQTAARYGEARRRHQPCRVLGQRLEALTRDSLKATLRERKRQGGPVQPAGNDLFGGAHG